MTICKEVAAEYRVRFGREGSDENLSKTLAVKLEKDRDLWLSRATMEDAYPRRVEEIR